MYTIELYGNNETRDIIKNNVEKLKCALVYCKHRVTFWAQKYYLFFLCIITQALFSKASHSCSYIRFGKCINYIFLTNNNKLNERRRCCNPLFVSKPELASQKSSAQVLLSAKLLQSMDIFYYMFDTQVKFLFDLMVFGFALDKGENPHYYSWFLLRMIGH